MRTHDIPPDSTAAEGSAESNGNRSLETRSRRTFLLAAGTTMAGLAGCAGGGGGGGYGVGGGGAGTPAPTATPLDYGGGGGAPQASQGKSVGGLTIPSDVMAKANEEGEVVITSSMDEPDMLDFVKPQFEEVFPGITVRVNAKGGAEIATQLIAEMRADNVTSDAVETNLATTRVMGDRGALMSFPSDHWLHQAAEELGYQEFYLEGNPFEFPAEGNSYTLLYNTEKLTESEAPDTWEGLGDDQWTGELGIVMQHPAQLSSMGGLFATLYETWGAEKWARQVARLMDNNPQLGSSNSQSYRVMVQGERAISPNYTNDLVLQLDRGEDPPAAAKWPEPSLLNYSPAAVVDRAPHPNAGRVAVAWWMSEAGQAMIGDTGRTPLLQSVAQTHDKFQRIIPEGVTIRPEGYNNPTYQGESYLQNPEAWVPLFVEHFGEQ